MKAGLHPDNYRLVIIEDTSNGTKFLTKSTAATDETGKWEDGKEYPLVKVHISSASHPFYTGEEKIVDVEGRVDRFKARAEAGVKKREALANKAKKQAKRTESKTAADTQKLGATSSNKQKTKQSPPSQPEKAPKQPEADVKPKTETKPPAETAKTEPKPEISSDSPSEAKTDKDLNENKESETDRAADKS